MDIENLLAHALQYQQNGHWHLAEMTYRQVLQVDTQNVDAWNNLGVVLQGANQLQAALDAYGQALQLDPNKPEVLHNIGNVFQSQDRLDQALPYYERALAINPDMDQTHCNLGMIKQTLGDPEGARFHYQEACRVNPQQWVAQYNLGVWFKERKNFAAALDHFAAVLALQPDFCEALNNVGSIYQEQGRLDEAFAIFHRALAVNPQHPDSLNNLGSTLHHMGRLDEAIHKFREVLVLQPDNALVMNNLGVVLSEKGDYNEAIQVFADTARIDPNYADPQCFKGFAELIQGDFKQGWADYEWRVKVQAYILKNNPEQFTQPLWDGSDLGGKTILIHAEQGFGDTMQFSRFLPLVRSKNPGKIIFQLQAGLKRLFANSPAHYDVLVHQFEPLPDHDIRLPLMSLPHLFEINLDTIPAPVPYLFAGQADIDKLAPRFIQDGTLKVGLVWGGDKQNRSNRNRSSALAQYDKLGQIPHVTFYSLQVGPPAQEAQNAPPGMRLIDLSDMLLDFADTAAAIHQLDLVISVDTSVVHLAGAMGKPVWNLLSFTPDWRWMLNRPDTPWYPTMRLFRQPTYRDWPSVFEALHAALRDFAQPDRQSDRQK